MAYLVGLEFPVNSVGELPLPFLDATDEQKAKALLVNAKEILEMYHVKEREKKATVFQYKPYSGFADAEHSVESRLAAVQQLINAGQFKQAIKDTDELIQLGLRGLRYLQTYAWLFLRTLVTAGYLGWIAFSFTTAIDLHMLDGKIEASRPIAGMITFSSILVGLFSLLLVQASPITYYIYAIFPVMFWEEVFARRHALIEGRKKLLSQFSKSDRTKLALNALAYVAMLEVMVQSYYHREIYTISYILAIAWPFFYGFEFVKKNALLCGTWAAACAAMSVFTLLPAMKLEDSNLIQFGGFLILMVGVLYIAFEKRLLVKTAPTKDSKAVEVADDGMARALLGVQVSHQCLVLVKFEADETRSVWSHWP
jgi:phosphatidylinositol glycan class N